MRASLVHRPVYKELFQEAEGSQVIVTRAWKTAMKKAVAQSRKFTREDVKNEIKALLKDKKRTKKIEKQSA